MVESAASCFSETELEHLRVLIGFTVEFHDYLQGGGKGPLEPRYTCESTFAGIESFTSVTRAYKGLVGSMNGNIEEDTISLTSLKAQFVPMFDEFVAEQDLGKKCRLLLDLFKLQIVFAGVLYE
jgi:hypothetical protein